MYIRNEIERVIKDNHIGRQLLAYGKEKSTNMKLSD